MGAREAQGEGSDDAAAHYLRVQRVRWVLQGNVSCQQLLKRIVKLLFLELISTAFLLQVRIAIDWSHILWGAKYVLWLSSVFIFMVVTFLEVQVAVIYFIWEWWRLQLLMRLWTSCFTWIWSQYACLVVLADVIHYRGLMSDDIICFLAFNYRDNRGSRLDRHWTLGRDVTRVVVLLSTNFIGDANVLVEVYPVI